MIKMYLEHFGLDELPFTLTPNTEFFCALTSHQEALNVILISLQHNEGFIKIIGEVGTGKTLLCRKLLTHLETQKDSTVTAYIANPNLGLYQAIAKELGININTNSKECILVNAITDKLLELYLSGRRVVLIIDEAQTLDSKTLEALRLLSNIETEATKLLQIVLFAQPEFDAMLDQKNLRQLKQRITFSHYLQPLNSQETQDYVNHRLNIAGYNKFGSIFTKRAHSLLHKASKGIPRIVNILCHKALMASYGMGTDKISSRSMLTAIKDTDLANKALKSKLYYFSLYVLILLLVVGNILVYFKLVGLHS